jgi:hypothetical protein
MTAGTMRREDDATKRYGVTVVENSVNAGRWVREYSIGAKGEVLAAAAAYYVGISIHDHVAGVSLLEHFCCTRHVIEVRLPVEKDLRVTPGKTKLFDACANLWRRAFKIRVDQDVSGWGRD